MGLDITDQLLIRIFFVTFIRYGRKMGYNETVHKLLIDFKKAYESIRKEVLYNILIKFGAPMKLFRLIKMYSDETYSKVCTGNFTIQNGLT
jgi:hypothetical protein